MTAHGVGASLRRKEDGRFLHGRGRYVGDLAPAGVLDVAFLRSPIAHARLLSVTPPEGAADRVFLAADLPGIAPISANSALPGFRASVQPALATGKLRHVGEAIAACIAPSRAEAEDLVAACQLDYDPLPAVTDMLAARAPGAPLIHEHWPDNAFLETRREEDLADLDTTAAAKVTRRLRTARQSMAPLEGRGVVAEWDPRLEQLIVTSSTQMPHVTKTGLAECLGLDEGQVRVIAPDVGGGFGYKGILLPEELVCASLAMRLGRPVRWLEDRLEQLTANANCREHHYEVTAWADAEGRLLGVKVDATVDAGAYSCYPFSACLEAAQIGSIFPGPYTLPRFAFHTVSACTNKPPIPALPRRRPHRRLLRHGNHAGRAGPQAGPIGRGDPPRQPRAARGDALPQPGRQGLRQRDYPKRCAAPSPPSISPPSAPARRPANASASASRSSASRGRMAPRSTTAGASPSCPATNRPRPASPPMACWNSAAACIATARG